MLSRTLICAIIFSWLVAGALNAAPFPSPQSPPLNSTRGDNTAQSPAASEAGNGAANANGTSASDETKAAIADVEAKLAELEKNTEVSATAKERLTARYRSTLETLRTYDAATESIAKFAQAATMAADNLVDARERLKQEATFAPPNDANYLGIDALRQRRSEANAALTAARQSLESLETTQRERETRRMLLPKLISDARAALEQAEATPPPAVEDDPQGTLAAAVEAEHAANLRLLRQTVELLQQEQLTIEAEAELIPARIELAKRDVTIAGKQLQFWSDKLGTQKQYRVENDLAQHREHLEEQGIAPEQSLVLTLEESWLEMLREQSRLESKKTREQARYAELSDVLKSTQTEIERDIQGGRGLRSGLGLKLQLARNRLPAASELNADIETIDELIDRAQALQTRLEIAVEDSRREGSTSLLLRPGSVLPMRDGVVDAQEVSLLRAMKSDVDQHLNLLVELKNELELKRKLVADLRLLIASHVVWIRSAPPFRWTDFSTAWWTLRRIVHPMTLMAVAQSLQAGLTQRFDLIVAWAVLGLGLWVVSARLRRRLTQTGEQLLQESGTGPEAESLRPTLIALAISVLLAVPPVVTLAVIGAAILEAANKDVFLSSVGSAFLLAAAALFPMESLRQMLRPSGVAIAHFGYRSESVTPLRTSLRLLIDLGIPLLVVWAVANDSARSFGDASLSRLIFAFGMVVLSYLLWQSLHPSKGLAADFLSAYPDSWTAKLQTVWHPLIASLPAILATLAVIGYVYTATLLTGRLYWTLWLGIAVLVMGGLLHQWFVHYRKRMAIMREAEKAIESQALEGVSIEVTTEPPIDAEEMNAQSLRVIQAVLWLVSLIGVYLIWSPVFPAVRFLNAVTLWPTTAADGTIVPVTLANLVVALPIIFLSFVAVRNIPGLLEGVLLERLPLDRAARYAITTLASYALAVVGIVLSANSLGLRWEGIQWLVAALGVGLGFGLQEIFANFISGLILLFEQPIRVGDVVTIDGVTGTVVKIRMRATVVKNHDMQELIIPNKDLITGRLINWTLTDSTNRLVLNIGVAYGSDTRKACQILEQICAQHENLLVDPAPVITFESFGDSTLNIVVRCFLGALDKRLETIHELNTTINDRFKEEAIEIAYPQRDLHIRSLPAGFMQGGK